MRARNVVFSIALAAGAACIPAAAVPAATAATAAPAATSSTSASTPVVHVHGLHIARNVHVPQTTLPKVTRAGAFTNPLYQSTNWSGYAAVADKGVKLTQVQAEFTVPSINCASAPSGAAESEWAGLDGIHSGTVEQEGVLAYCDTTTNAPTYYAWYEMYPKAAVAYTGTINPGDAIVVKTGKYKTVNQFALSLQDVTTGAGFSATAVPCPGGRVCPASSAEAILEAPFNGSTNAQAPLADYGFVNFVASQLSVNYLAKANFSSTSKSYALWQINMVSSSGVKQSLTTSLLGGRDFTANWRHV